jgi:hypothetical protein
MANKPYENYVLAAKIEDMYNTHVAMNNYLTVDNDLQSAAGDHKIINVYTATGDVEDVTMGNGNTKDIEATFSPVEYKVGKTQGRGTYYDEEVDKDPKVVEVILEGMAAKMANDHTTKVIAEFAKSRKWNIYTTPDFSTFADAIAKLNMEQEEPLFAMACPTDLAAIREALKDDLKYVESFVRSGYVGNVCNVPLVITKAVSAGTIYIATKKAVTLFNKRGMEVETKRDPDLRKNQMFNRKTCLVALTDATKLIKLTKYPDALITTGLDLFITDTASATAGSTVITVSDIPDGYKWAYKAGTSAATCTFGTAISGYTDITAEATTIAMSTNTHLTLALVNATDNKPVACVDYTGTTLKVGE